MQKNVKALSLCFLREINLSRIQNLIYIEWYFKNYILKRYHIRLIYINLRQSTKSTITYQYNNSSY